MSKTLTHVGVLGMHWGQRKTPEQVLQGKQKKWESQVSGHFLKAYNRASDRMNNGEIARINNKAIYKDKNFTDPKHADLYKKYIAEYEGAFQKALNEEMNRAAGPSPMPNKTIEAVPTRNGYDFYVKDTTP